MRDLLTKIEVLSRKSSSFTKKEDSSQKSDLLPKIEILSRKSGSLTKAEHLTRNSDFSGNKKKS